MASKETSAMPKEPGIRSPGIRGIEIEKLNPRQMAQFMGWEFYHNPEEYNLPESWQYQFPHGNPSSNIWINLLVTPTQKTVEVSLIEKTSKDQTAQVAHLILRNVKTANLLNYNGKRVIFRGQESDDNLIFSDKGGFRGSGLRYLS